MSTQAVDTISAKTHVAARVQGISKTVFSLSNQRFCSQLIRSTVYMKWKRKSTTKCATYCHLFLEIINLVWNLVNLSGNHVPLKTDFIQGGTDLMIAQTRAIRASWMHCLFLILRDRSCHSRNQLRSIMISM